MSRLDYVKYDEEATSLQALFKMTFDNLVEALEKMPSSREAALAITKLEESYMWVGKAIRNNQLKRKGS